MSVDNVQSRSTATTYSSDQTTQSNGDVSDMFLKLLVAQIQNQDPSNPTDSSQYISQLSQLSQMESMQGLTQAMGYVSLMAESIQQMGMSNLVGQQVFVSSDNIQVENQANIEGRLTLAHPANTVTVNIKDSTGKEVKLELDKNEAGDVNFTIDPEALGLADGKYTLSVVTDTGEEGVTPEIAGTVNSVRFTAEGPMLTIPGLGEVAYAYIRQFGNAASPATSGEAKRFALPQSSFVNKPSFV